MDSEMRKQEDDKSDYEKLRRVEPTSLFMDAFWYRLLMCPGQSN